ncbi:MAG: hypothetical protein AMJ95_10475 [Omnitrophica WOR_2 bacterium SM23_72]|nr:MAG: hypothetical protein AMJ95_10475 [Omnitrophica WOR_2 bacterium SM23_72]
MKIKKLGNDTKIKQCVISLGIGRKIFVDCLKRLEESLRRVRFSGDFLYWSDELPPGSPTHFEAPFGFKPFCFLEAAKLGYEEILWIDSACVAIRPLEPIFKILEQKGYCLFANNYGQMMGQWCSDEVLRINNITREEALKIPEVPCSVIGLNLQNALASKFLQMWHQKAADGITFRGIRDKIDDWEDYYDIAWNKSGRVSKDPRVRGHRHDQSAAGIIAHELHMRPFADGLGDIHYKGTAIDRNTIILHHREFGEKITPLNDIYLKVFVMMPFIERPLDLIRAFLKSIRNKLKGLCTH